MTTAPVIIDGLAAIVLSLTPEERWKAAGSRLGTSFIEEHWYVLTAAAVIIILTVLLLVFSLRRRLGQRRVTKQLFVEHSDKSGLSGRERQILLEIAGKAGLKRNEAVFTMASAFDRGAAKIVEENLTQQGTEESKVLRTELSFLREKLGFQKKTPISIGSPTKSRKLSSRQIPAGKKLHITRRKTRDLASIESTVIKNNDMELTVKLAMSVESKAGELWSVRYYFGASVWEFDTSVVSCNGDILVLNHSDNVRFINRRRFLRVPVNKPAFIASFPFARTLPANEKANAPGSTWGPPKFVPAVVTELAGPGLRIEVPLEVKVGERMLVLVRLDEENNKGPIPMPRNRKKVTSIIEDIGEVRHTKAIQNGFSVAVELTGLSDSDVNELIRATNAASTKARIESQDASASAGDKEEAEEGAAKPAVV